MGVVLNGNGLFVTLRLVYIVVRSIIPIINSLSNIDEFVYVEIASLRQRKKSFIGDISAYAQSRNSPNSQSIKNKRFALPPIQFIHRRLSSC